ncbi:MAG: D-Ala-D-Ala carboxypeptidase family metallohydrolase [Arenimonas sp.]
MREKHTRVDFKILLTLFLLAIYLSGCVVFRKPTDAERYAAWSRKHGDEILAYQNFLDENAVGDIVPLSQLLKSARDWKKCKAEPFTMPPRELWPNIVPTLRVVKKFKTEGVLINPMAASVYRDPILNVCAGGSPKSKHMQLNAIDFDIDATPKSLETLCNAWKTSGQELKLGLGFYTPTRIHLDTLGYRSWGSDHTHKTSLCLQSN